MGSWKIVNSFSGSSDDALSRLDGALASAGINVTRFEAETGARAILAPLASIQQACHEAKFSFSIQGSEPDPATPLLALSTESPVEDLRPLLNADQGPFIGMLSATGANSFVLRPAPPSVPPLKKKIAEGPDHLRRRAEWFKRRTGGTS